MNTDTRQCKLFYFHTVYLNQRLTIPILFQPLFRHAAASYNELGAIEFLINLGADVNIRDNDGDTPLLVAEAPATFDMLVKLGADPNAKNHAGESIIEKIVEDNNAELFEYLVQIGFISDSSMIAQVRSALDAGEDGGNNGVDFNLEVVNEEDENNDDMHM